MANTFQIISTMRKFKRELMIWPPGFIILTDVYFSPDLPGSFSGTKGWWQVAKYILQVNFR